MIKLGDIRRKDGSVVMINDASIGPIEELTIQIPLEQYENGQIKSHTGVTVRHINSLLVDGGIYFTADSPIGFRMDDGSMIEFTEAKLNPLEKKLYADTVYDLTEDEMTKFFNMAHIRNRVFSEDFGANVAKGSYDILSGKMLIEWKKFTLDGSVLPSKQGKENNIRFYYTINDADIPKDSENQIGSHHKVVTIFDVKASNGAVFNVSSGMKRIVFTVPEAKTPEECANYLKIQNEGKTPVSFAWELAQPIEIQYEPRRLLTYYKANTLWNNIGEVF